MYQIDVDKMYWEKIRHELRKNPTILIEQILEAAHHERTAVQPLSPYV